MQSHVMAELRKPVGEGRRRKEEEEGRQNEMRLDRGEKVRVHHAHRSLCYIVVFSLSTVMFSLTI